MKTLLKALYESEINILIDWMWDSGIQVKIGDRMNGFVAVEIFDIDDFEKIEDWIETNVKEHFPNSTFSKTYKSDDMEYCMPDGINSKEEHEEYLKAIGYEKYVKGLEHHKDTTTGLYAIDFDPKELIKRFVDSQSDATRLVVEDVEDLVEDWCKFIENKNIGKSPFFRI